MAFGYSSKERSVKQNQSPKDTRRPPAKYVVFYLYSPKGATYLKLPTLYRLKITNFSYPLSFSALDQGDPFRIYGKALLTLKLESSRQPTVKI